MYLVSSYISVLFNFFVFFGFSFAYCTCFVSFIRCISLVRLVFPLVDITPRILSAVPSFLIKLIYLFAYLTPLIYISIYLFREKCQSLNVLVTSRLVFAVTIFRFRFSSLLFQYFRISTNSFCLPMNITDYFHLTRWKFVNFMWLCQLPTKTLYYQGVESCLIATWTVSILISWVTSERNHTLNWWHFPHVGRYRCLGVILALT